MTKQDIKNIIADLRHVTLKQKKAINGLFCDFRSARGEFYECNGHKAMYFNL